MNHDFLTSLTAKKSFSALDIHFAGLMTRLSGQATEELYLAAALVSRYQREGHICFDLSLLAGKRLEDEDPDSPVCPHLDSWRKDLEKAEAVGRPGEFKPLILDGNKLYLFRYWEYEKKLLDMLKGRAAGLCIDMEDKRLKEGLTRLFPDTGTGETDWQKLAAFTAALKNLCVISGGPGTGKTYTVAKILALLLELENRPLRMSLAAPTGKAAVRIQEALKQALEKLNCSAGLKALIPQEATTIHRLLRPIPDSPYFRYGPENPLPADVVVVDEASMVDLALLSKLAAAVPGHSRLIILGDKDQLASVEAGTVLGDICDTGQEHGYSRLFREGYRKATGETLPTEKAVRNEPGIGDSMVQLKKSYRFGPASGIGALSRAVNEGNGPEAIGLLKSGLYRDIQWQELPRPEALSSKIKNRVVSGFANYLRADNPEEALNLFSHFRILGALREGPFGVQGLNFQAEKILRQAGLIPKEGRWYPGRPVMVTRNDYTLKLFNGDIGLTLADPQADNQLRVFFPSLDGGIRKFPPLRLPDHETVYAMTVHKGQGSEFNQILFILPVLSARVLTRELIYTALTRAKEAVEVWGRADILQAAIARRIIRTSGLRDGLWGNPQK
jgi:exodeoxyribonuclease V alpha subunit